MATSRRPASRAGSVTSSKHDDMFDLDRDLPTTAEDVQALRRAAGSHRLDFHGYLRFLAQLPEARSDARRHGLDMTVRPPFVLSG